MCVEAFLFGEVGDLVGHLAQGVLRKIGELGLLHEIVHAERGGEPGGAGGGEGMVGTCEVVAQGFGAVLAHEDGTGVLHGVQIVEGIVNAELQMLRCNLVGEIWMRLPRWEALSKRPLISRATRSR